MTDNNRLGPRIVVALDYANADQALVLADRLDPDACRVKVGKELFTRAGPNLVRRLVEQGFGVFLDLKFHDIPNTVAAACKAAADLGVWMVNIHTSGGRRMMEAAREALPADGNSPLLIGVTVLTSLDDRELQEVGFRDGAVNSVRRLASLANDCGLDGVVCSPQEVSVLRGNLGGDFLLVTPGIRPAASGADDQRRVMTPAEAVSAGSSYLVIGRPITRAESPLQALRGIQEEIDAVL
ncbi:MAG: orotidine-5'-phosphate decarboxylase [Chromatiales bacterium]|nr:orotidine-5'-phosphate decarboxylase [Chromatiales bacterium]